MNCAKRASTNLFQEVIFVVGSPLTCHVIKVKKRERERGLGLDTQPSLHSVLLTFYARFSNRQVVICGLLSPPRSHPPIPLCTLSFPQNQSQHFNMKNTPLPGQVKNSPPILFSSIIPFQLHWSSPPYGYGNNEIVVAATVTNSFISRACKSEIHNRSHFHAVAFTHISSDKWASK